MADVVDVFDVFNVLIFLMFYLMADVVDVFKANATVDLVFHCSTHCIPGKVHCDDYDDDDDNDDCDDGGDDPLLQRTLHNWKGSSEG